MKILSLNRKFIARRVNQLKICNKFQISSKTKYHLEKKKNILVRLSGDPVSMASVHLSAYETRRFDHVATIRPSPFRIAPFRGDLHGNVRNEARSEAESELTRAVPLARGNFPSVPSRKLPASIDH